jgi:SET domain
VSKTPENISYLSSTRVKPLQPNIERLHKYAQEIKVNQSKLRMFHSGFGRGICTASTIGSGQAICEYSGKVISKSAAEHLSDQGKGCYIFHVKLDNEVTVCIDATAEDETPGRLINHSLRNGNVKSKKVEIGDTVRLFFVAMKNIPANCELLYDYGDRSCRSDKFLHDSPIPCYVKPSQFCGSFSNSQVLVPVLVPISVMWWSTREEPGYVAQATFSNSRNSLQETPGEKPEGSRAARVVGAALESSGFSPGVSQRELLELEKVAVEKPGSF